MPVNSITSIKVTLKNERVSAVEVSGQIQTAKGALDTYKIEIENVSSVLLEDGGDSKEINYIRINDTDSQITYSGTWHPYSGDPTFYDGDEHYSNEANAYAEFNFHGTAIRLIGATSDNLGKCDVYVDGVLEVEGLDLYSSSLEAQKVLFSKEDLSNGHHTIKIVATGEKNPSSTEAYVTIDAFEYGE